MASCFSLSRNTVRRLLMAIPVLTTTTWACAQAAPHVPEDRIYKDNIHTVELYREGWDLSYPYIELHSGDRLTLEFDELGTSAGNYCYTFIHCDAYWHPSGMSEFDYLEGFTENQVRQYNYSFNTTTDYVHYSLTFPDENTDFRISGNYVLLVYEDYDESKPVITRRFSVYENLVGIQAVVRPPSLPAFMNSGHEVDVEVSHGSYPIRNPVDELHLVIRQNGRWDNMIQGLKPLFVRGTTLSFDYNRENVFQGVNEFRYFDIRSFRYQSEFVKSIDYRAPAYHIELTPCESRAGKGYFSDQEINGKFKIEVQEGQNPDTDADYAWVYFTLPAAFPYNNAGLYVMGNLTGWTLENRSKMRYSQARHQYELSLLLKQGYYNYWLTVLPEGNSRAEPSVIEGSHRETENDYLVCLYHRPAGARYDRLIGFVQINSQTSY